MALFLFWFLSFMIWELTLRTAISPSFFSIYLIIVLFFSASYSALLGFVSDLFRRHRPRIFMSVAAGIISFVYASQLIYYRFFKVLYALKSVKHGGQVAQFAGDIFKQVLHNIPVLIVLFIPLIVLLVPYTWNRLKKYFFPKKKPSVVLRAGTLLLSWYFFAMAVLLVAFGPDTVNSPRQVLTRTNAPVIAADRVGLVMAMFRDATAKTQGGTTGKLQLPSPEENPNMTDTSASEGTPSATDTAGSALPAAPVSAVKREPNILPWLDFKAMAEKETDEDLKQMDLYFAQADPSLTNEKTGLYKGYNFIFITAESFSRFAVDPKLMPTLYSMQQNGYQFTRFYNPVWAVSTLDGEYSGLLGTIPKGGVWSMLESSKNTMDYAPGNLFRREGYNTFAYHDHYWDYYERDKSHPNLGYDYKGLGHGLDVTETWPESDLEMMQLSVKDFIDKEPFHVYYLTVSGHMNYSFYGNAMADKHYDEVKDLPLSEQARAYLACNIELDRAMEYLLKQLREAGVAERTVIALNADHYPYGLDKAVIDELAGETVEDNFELYRGTFLLYVDGQKPEIIDKPACSLDCIETCYNMLGVPFDSRLLSGRDIFSTTEPLCMFMNRSWITDQGRYNALTDTFTPDFSLTNIGALDPAYAARAKATAEEIKKNPAPYVDRINQKVANRFAIAEGILDHNYYQHLRDMGYEPK